MKRTMAMMVAAAALTAVLGSQAAAMDWQAPVAAARHAIAKMLNGTFLASPTPTADGSTSLSTPW